MGDYTSSWIVIEENNSYFVVNVAKGSKLGPFSSEQKATAFAKEESILANAAAAYNIESSDEKWHP